MGSPTSASHGFQVVAQAGTTIQLLSGSTVLGSSVAASAGIYTISPTQPLIDGIYAVQCRLVDLAGNLGSSSTAFGLVILTATPPTPSSPVILPADLSGPSGGTLTNIRQPRFTGTAKTGTTVQILSSTGIFLGSAIATGGIYTVKLVSPWSDGTYQVKALAVDVAANQSPSSAASSVTIDGTPPGAPTGPDVAPPG